MSHPLLAPNVLIVGSLLYCRGAFSRPELLEWWQNHLGPCDDWQHQHFPMADYYSKEMSGELNRLFIVSRETFPREILQDLKWWSLAEEKKFSRDGARTLNIDMGYLALEHMILATFKPYSHRPYLGRGVYLEMVYQTCDGHFQNFPWTYPDYAHQEIRQFFDQKRDEFKKNKTGLKRGGYRLW